MVLTRFHIKLSNSNSTKTYFTRLGRRNTFTKILKQYRKHSPDVIFANTQLKWKRPAMLTRFDAVTSKYFKVSLIMFMQVVSSKMGL